MELVRADIQVARDSLSRVALPEEAASLGLEIINQLQIDSLRAEITLFEAARAYAAIDGRFEVTPADLLEVAPMSLQMRRTSFIKEFCTQQQVEVGEIMNISHSLFKTAVSKESPEDDQSSEADHGNPEYKAG
jgi:Mg-chelatase subunit ChlI